MHIVHVFIHVKPDKVEEFKLATIENARSSLKEPGVARFDFNQQADDHTRFVLVEVYRTVEDAAKHKETAHYNRWREAAEPLLAEARTRTIYKNVFPDETGWG
jgi:(4S)-4-hydroxy-5-phosphonooxypentane-2,3-dione isomerase